jgi:hypothetical protein
MHSRVLPSDSGGVIAGVAQLLCEGGDERIELDPATGLNRYLCAAAPDPELAAFGSSTASTISTVAWAAAERLSDELQVELQHRPAAVVYERRLEALRIELLRLCGLETKRGLEVVIAPSGTDLHRLAARLTAGPSSRPSLAIIGEAAETGSGVPGALASGAEVVSVSARAADGRLRDEASVDAEVEALACEAVADLRRVLLVITDVSKTGLLSPNPAVARELCRRFPGWVDVLVDACQMRLSPASLGGYADLGWMIAVTGSKFLTGPAFSAALFVPRKTADRLKRRHLAREDDTQSLKADWPQGWAAAEALEDGANLGLLLRWEAAMAELRALRQVPEPAASAFLAGFERAALGAIARGAELEPLEGRRPSREGLPAGGWDEIPGIFPFLLKGPSGCLTPDQTKRVWALLRQDLSHHARTAGAQVAPIAAALRVEMGQPVACGERRGAPAHALRLCASARLIVEGCSAPAAAEAVLLRARQALTKASWLAGEVSAGRL